MPSLKSNNSGVAIVIQKADHFLLTKDPHTDLWNFPNMLFHKDKSTKEQKENISGVDTILHDLGISSSLVANRKLIEKVVCNHSSSRCTFAVEYLELIDPLNPESVTKQIKWLTKKEIGTIRVSSMTKKLLNVIHTHHKNLKKASVKRNIEDTKDELIPSPAIKKFKAVKNNDESIDDIPVCDVSFELVEELAILTAIKQIYIAIQNKNKKLKQSVTNRIDEAKDTLTSKNAGDSIRKADKIINDISRNERTSSSEQISAVSLVSSRVSKSAEGNKQKIYNSFSVTNAGFKKTLVVPGMPKKVPNAVESTKKTLISGDTGVKRPLVVSKDVMIECEVVKESCKTLHKTSLNVPVKKNGKNMKQTSIKSFFVQK